MKNKFVSKKKEKEYNIYEDDLTIQDIEGPEDAKVLITSQKLKKILICLMIIVIVKVGFYIGYEDSKNISLLVEKMNPYGFWIHASVLPIFILFIFIILFVSYDFLTYMRRKICRMRFVTLFDNSVYFHKFCGYLLLIFSIYHSIFHFVFTLHKVRLPKEKLNILITKQNYLGVLLGSTVS